MSALVRVSVASGFSKDSDLDCAKRISFAMSEQHSTNRFATPTTKLMWSCLS